MKRLVLVAALGAAVAASLHRLNAAEATDGPTTAARLRLCRFPL